MVRLSREYDPEEVSNIIRVLMKALKGKDEYTYGHSCRVGHYAAAVAKVMQLSEDDVFTARVLGMLHDIGKLFVPDAILCKPAALTHAEKIVMRKHSTDAVRILQCMSVTNEHLLIVRSLHERFDGQGYPDGLAGEAIPVVARILAVTDSYDAMITDRPYRPAMPQPDAFEELTQGRGQQFCPAAVDAMLHLLKSKSAAAELPSDLAA